MSYETILFGVEGGVARLTLNRPDKLNSFNVRMHEEVRHALDTVRGGPARVLDFLVHAHVEAVEFVRPIEGEARDAAFDAEQDGFIRHGRAPRASELDHFSS